MNNNEKTKDKGKKISKVEKLEEKDKKAEENTSKNEDKQLEPEATVKTNEQIKKEEKTNEDKITSEKAEEKTSEDKMTSEKAEEKAKEQEITTSKEDDVTPKELDEKTKEQETGPSQDLKEKESDEDTIIEETKEEEKTSGKKITVEKYNQANSEKFGKSTKKKKKTVSGKFKRTRNSKIRKFLLILIYVLVILLGILLWNNYQMNELEKINEEMQIYEQPAYALPIKEKLVTKPLTNAQASDKFSEQMIGYIAIPAVDLKVPIMQAKSSEEDDMQNVMKQTVAHDPQTLLPGEGGNIVLTGHREEQFSALEFVEIDDLVLVVIQENIYLYQIKETKIVEGESSESFNYVYNNPEKEQLTMFTCYPFNRLTFPNQRKVIKADRIASYNQEIDFREEE